MNSGQGATRLYYMDNLRALAMLVGLFFHAALAYSPLLHSFWPAADAQNHWLFDVFAQFSHLFRMPVFFMLAGFFCALLLQKRGAKAFCKNRLLRIALPLILFLPILSISMMWIILFALENVQNPSPFLSFVYKMMAMPNPPPPPLSTMHLWFLYHLLFLYLLTFVFKTLIPEHLIKHLTSLKPLPLLLVCSALILPALYVVSAPFPAPEWIFPALWALVFYGVFFALGYAYFFKPNLLKQFEAHLPFYLLVGLISYALYYYLLPSQLLPDTQIIGLQKLAITGLETISSITLTISVLLYAKRWLNFSNTLLAYISKVSYWVYLVHLPIVFWLQFLLMDVNWHLGLKFFIASIGTLSLCLISFHLLVSWTWLARMLVGNAPNKCLTGSEN